MKSSPSLQFYPADWLRDPGLRSCSLAARGLWIDMMAFMHEADPYGHLRLNSKDIEPAVLARMVGSALEETQHILHELEDAGVFSLTEQGTIFSRRMVRDHELREKRGQYGHLSQAHPLVPRKKVEMDTLKVAMKDTGKDTLPGSMGVSIGGSPSSSSSSSSSKDKKKKETTPPAVDLEFEAVWIGYPMRNGKRVGKPKALRNWKKLNEEDRKLVCVAVRHYAMSELALKGIGIKDLHRWLRDGKDDEPWRDWVEPEQRNQKLSNGHAPSLTCTKRLQNPGEKFLRACGQSASPESRPTEPRCSQHLSEADKLKESIHAAR